MMISHSVHGHASAFAGRKQQSAPITNTRSKCVAAASRLSFGSDDSLCPVSYSTDYLPSSWHRTMPTAARLAFKALERDTTVAIARSRMPSTATAATSTAQQSAIDTLCLVTYSDDEDASSSWHKQQQQGRLAPVFTGSLAAAAAAATARAHPRTAAAVFAAFSSDDQAEEGGEGLPGVMETLCMLSYDEESA